METMPLLVTVTRCLGASKSKSTVQLAKYKWRIEQFAADIRRARRAGRMLERELCVAGNM